MYHILAVLACVFWGSTFVSTKILLTAGMSPSMIFFLRFLIAYLAMLPFCHRRPFFVPWRDELRMCVAGMTGGSLFFLAENVSLLYVQSASVSFISSLPPLLLVVWAVLYPGSKVRSSWRLWVGALLAVVGLWFVVGDLDPAASPRPLLGCSIALLSALLWCVYQLIVNPLSEKYGIDVTTRKIFGYGVVTIFPLIATELPELPALFAQSKVWINILFLGLVASLFCFFAWNIVMEHMGAIKSSNYLYLNPLVTCVAAWFVLGEQVTVPMMLGGLCILIGIYLGVKPEKRNAT